MKNRFFLALVSLFILQMSSAFCTTYNVNGSYLSVSKYTTNLPPTRYQTQTHMIGREYNSFMSMEEISRTQYDFNLTNVPSSETITSIKLKYTVGLSVFSKTYYFNITQITTPKIYANQDLYDCVISSTKILENVNYYNSEVSNSSFLNLVSSSRGGHLYLGAYSANEAADDSYGNLYLSIEIVTSAPPPPQNITINATNNFETTTGNGRIIVDSQDKPAPWPIPKTVGQTATLQAISGQIDKDAIERVWVDGCNWTKTNAVNANQPISNNTSITYNTDPLTAQDNNATFKANLKKQFNVNVQNSNPDGGIVKIVVDGVEYDVPHSGLAKGVGETKTCTLKAVFQTVNYIDYSFQGWRDESGQIVSTASEMTITPTNNKSYTAVFRGTATTTMMNSLSNSSVVGQYPAITWTDNPNPAVSYKIYRTIYRDWQGQNLVIYPRSYVTTVPQGTQNYQCNVGVVSGSAGNDLLHLELAVYYSTENTEHTADYFDFLYNGIWGEDPNPPQSKRNTGINNDAVITKYAVANYPNPFNPATVINYQVPEAGHVTLKVYDVMGKEIVTLIDGVKTKGSYNVNFSMDQYHLASGIYFCRLSAGKNVVTTKMILSK